MECMVFQRSRQGTTTAACQQRARNQSEAWKSWPPGVRRLRALEDGFLAEALAELLGEPAHAGRRPADIERT